jgi:hypothetical protein
VRRLLDGVHFLVQVAALDQIVFLSNLYQGFVTVSLTLALQIGQFILEGHLDRLYAILLPKRLVRIEFGVAASPSVSGRRKQVGQLEHVQDLCGRVQRDHHQRLRLDEMGQACFQVERVGYAP